MATGRQRTAAVLTVPGSPDACRRVRCPWLLKTGQYWTIEKLVVKLAVGEAQKHCIQVSFHCPGWSASGGPWVTPEMAMHELTWSETHVDGGRELALSLPQPPTKLGYYRDIALLAFPLRAGDDWTP